MCPLCWHLKHVSYLNLQFPGVWFALPQRQHGACPVASGLGAPRHSLLTVPGTDSAAVLFASS